MLLSRFLAALRFNKDQPQSKSETWGSSSSSSGIYSESCTREARFLMRWEEEEEEFMTCLDMSLNAHGQA